MFFYHGEIGFFKNPFGIRFGAKASAFIASIETPQGKVNLLDTPGFSVFLGDSRAACRVADAALFVVSAAASVSRN